MKPIFSTLEKYRVAVKLKSFSSPYPADDFEFLIAYADALQRHLTEAKEQLQKVVAAFEWIDCKEQFPPDKELVLCFIPMKPSSAPDEYILAYRLDGDWVDEAFGDTTNHEESGITHWARLTAPKENS